MDWTNFPWRAGMRFRMDNGTHHRLSAAIGHRLRSQGEDCYGYMEPIDAKVAKSFGFVPDLSDPATVGALAGAVREAWEMPYLMAAVDPGFDAFPTQWAIINERGQRMAETCATEALAWLAAWNARPR